MLGLNDVLGWSFPLLSTRRLTVRISWILLVWMLFDAINAGRSQSWELVAAAFIVPPLTMLIHALAHVWVARRCGGSVNSTVLSALVDQTDFSLPMRPWPHVLVGIAGPASNLAIAGLAWLGVQQSSGAVANVLGYVIWINVVVGIANLLACSPFDGQRWWRGLLWLFFPMAKAVRIALILGIISAVLMIVFAAWTTSFLFLFCGIASLLATIADRQSVANGHDQIFLVDPAYGGQAPASNWSKRSAERRAAAAEREIASEQEILDRLLAKVSAAGLPSLTQAERKQLQQISQRQKERAADR